MAAARRSDGGGGFVAVLGTLPALSLIVTYFCWIVGTAAALGLVYAVVALVRREQRRRDLDASDAAWERDVLRARADRQNRWLLAGDSRGVYGPDGAAAGTTVTPPSPPPAGDDPPTCAALATTPTGLTALAASKPFGWEHALFASVMVQRTAAVLDRLRDSEMGFIPSPTRRISSGRDLSNTLTLLVDGMLGAMRQTESFTMAPGFMAAFGPPGGSGDADALTHNAHRLMDYRDWFLELSEECRELSVPSRWSDAQADCARLLDGPLQSFRDFIEQFAEVVDDVLPVVAADRSTGVVHLGSLGLFLSVDDPVRARLFRRLEVIEGS